MAAGSLVTNVAPAHATDYPLDGVSPLNTTYNCSADAITPSGFKKQLYNATLGYKPVRTSSCGTARRAARSGPG
jgi:hypothetical protein